MPQLRSRPTKRAQELRNNATDAERKLWRRLSRRQLEGFKFSRRMPIGPYICDFLCRECMLTVEVDGGQHAESPRDETRTAFLEGQGYRVIRFWNNDVLGNTVGVLEAFALELRSSPPPTPSRQREGSSPAPPVPLPLAGGGAQRSGEGVGLTKQPHRTAHGESGPTPYPLPRAGGEMQ